MSHPIPGHDYDEPTNPALEGEEPEFDGQIRIAPPSIADDIETVVNFILEHMPPSEEECRAALRVEAWLATYRTDHE